jgi:hypothetical protein
MANHIMMEPAQAYTAMHLEQMHCEAVSEVWLNQAMGIGQAGAAAKTCGWSPSIIHCLLL